MFFVIFNVLKGIGGNSGRWPDSQPSSPMWFRHSEDCVPSSCGGARGTWRAHRASTSEATERIGAGTQKEQ